MSEPRFELLDSYARELDHDADLIVPPTSAAHVRRIGRSRRTRRTIIAVVILVVVLLGVGATLVASSAMMGDVPPWATAPSPTQASPAPTRTATTSASATPSAQTSVTTTPTPASTRTASATSTRTTSTSATASVGAVVTLSAPLELKSAADINAVAWMNGATKSFFVSELARVRTAAGCDDYLIVQAYRGTDLISGSTFGCDSAQITWGNLAGTWKVVFAGQAVPYCTEVRSSGWKSTIPQDFAGGQCYDASGNLVPYTP